MKKEIKVNYDKVLIFVVIALIFLIVALRVSFFYVPKCDTFECFQENMRACKQAVYLNEEPQATWKYEILGKEKDECLVKTSLIQPKQGELKLEKLAGLSMTCAFPLGITTYPEKYLDRCHGLLKEELQTIIIEKLHTYIIENIGDVDESLDLISSF